MRRQQLVPGIVAAQGDLPISNTLELSDGAAMMLEKLDMQQHQVQSARVDSLFGDRSGDESMASAASDQEEHEEYLRPSNKKARGGAPRTRAPRGAPRAKAAARQRPPPHGVRPMDELPSEEVRLADGFPLVPPPAEAEEALPPMVVAKWAPMMQDLIQELGPPPDNSLKCWGCCSGTMAVNVDGIVELKKLVDVSIESTEPLHVGLAGHSHFTRKIRRFGVQSLLKSRLTEELMRRQLPLPMDWELVECVDNDHDIQLRESHPLCEHEWVREEFARCKHEYGDWSPQGIFWHYVLHDCSHVRFVLLTNKLLSNMCLHSMMYGAWVQQEGNDHPTISYESVKMIKELLALIAKLNDTSTTRKVNQHRETLMVNSARDTQNEINTSNKKLLVARRQPFGAHQRR